MEETQSFRLTETMDSVKINISHIGGQNIVHWEDIEQVFPGAKRVHDGNSVITFHRNSSQENVNCCSHSVLDVVLSTSLGPEGVNPSKLDSTDRQTDLTDAPVEDRVIVALDVTPETSVGNLDTSSIPSSNDSISSKAALFRQVVTHASRKARESEIEQRFISHLVPEVQETVRASSDIYQAFINAIKDGNGGLSRADLRQELEGPFQKLEAMMAARNTELQEEMSVMRKEMNAKQEEMIKLQEASDAKQNEIICLQLEMKQMQQRALDQLADLQFRVQAVLTQTYELHEYPIPRLFVVLPQDPSRWDTVDPFSNKFRLYFLCECGEHTKSIDSQTNIPHHIHVAKHEGYEITRPSEFFQQYGSYVVKMLQMLTFGLKLGITVAGVVIPGLPFVISAESIGQVATSAKHWQESIEHGVNRTIGYIDSVLTHDNIAIDPVENKEVLEGADLRKLVTFLKTKDEDKVLGNLYRTVTDEGHVKWVCIDHYRENYQKGTAQEFQSVLDSVGGSFDRSIGRVVVKLPSRVLANLFFKALKKARSVYELEMIFDWACSISDLELLERALRRSRVSILRLDIQQFRISNLSSASAQYGILLRIKGLPNMRIIHLVLSKDVIKLISIQPRTQSCICKLSIEVPRGSIDAKRVMALAEVLKTNRTLTALSLRGNSIGDDEGQALAEALKINSTLTTLDLTGNSIGENGAQALSKALKINATLTTLNLGANSIGDNGVEALSEALKTNTTLTTLDLGDNSIGDNGAQTLAETLKTNKTLTTLNLLGNQIWIKGLAAISEISTQNPILTTLDQLNVGYKAILMFEAFKPNSTMTFLRLSICSIGDNGAQALSEALKTNLTLTTLYLDYNVIGDAGAQALSEALKANSTLTTLDLRGKSIGDLRARALSEALKANSTLTTLYLVGNSIRHNGAQALSEALKTNSTLITLDLYYNAIGDLGARALSEALKFNSTLTTLDLTGNSVGENGAQALSEALKSNSTLLALDLFDNTLGDVGAQALSEALKTNSTLITLNLGGKSIGHSGVQALSEALKINSTLTTLKLAGNSIGHNGAQALAEALKTNSTLTNLNLSYNSIGDVGAQALSEALTANSILTTLNLFGNLIAQNGAQALSKALKINSTLTALDLGRNSIGDNGGQALCETFKINSTLTALALNFNSFGDNGAQALSEALKTNSTLTTLDLGNNSIGNRGAQALCEALKTNSTLTTLNLGYNSIEDNGAQALSEALQTNWTLTTLGLHRNSIGESGIQALSEAHKTNMTLKTFYFAEQND
ncbi:hypothetical protein EC968_003976 [Mortierella alpina]|nr:hypothetical protein EC968_003976 [Mortierella alpina]